MSDLKQQHIFACQVKALHQQTLPSFLGNLISGCVLCYAEWDVIPNKITIFCWLGLLVLSIILRAIVAYCYLRANPREEDAGFWLKIFMVGLVFSAIIWASAVIVLLPTDDLPHRVFLVFIMTFLMVEAVNILSSVQQACNTFLILLVLPLTITFLLSTNHIEFIMGIMLLPYSVVMFKFSRNFNHTVTEALRYRFELEQLVLIDSLTSISNRRHFDMYIQQEWSRAMRNNANLSLILIDVDNFKAYNDHYGHQAGDDCLRQVASSLRQTAKRSSDLVARYGGEEFVVVLPETTSSGTLNIAQKLHQVVEGLNIEHKYSLAAPVVTISVGVSSIVPTEGFSMQNLIYAADQALYNSKHNGRNQVSLGEVHPNATNESTASSL